jgi:hypothetical protein
VTCLSLFHYERFLATGKRKRRRIGRKCQRHVTFLSLLPFDLNLRGMKLVDRCI